MKISINILRSRLDEIDTAMNKILSDTKNIDEEIESGLERKNTLNERFNKLDEESVEIKESIYILMT